MIGDYFGYEIYITISILLFIAAKYLFRGKKFKVVRQGIMIVLYSSFCFVVFINGGVVAYIWQDFDFKFGNNIELATIAQTSALLFQVFLVIRYKDLKDVFIQGLGCALIQLFFSVIIFFISGMGVIKPVWFFIMIAAMGGYFFCSWGFIQINDLLSTNQSLTSKEDKVILYDKIQIESNRLFKVILQSILALGASLGIAMSILFKDGENSWENLDYLMNATRMILAFGLIVLGFAFWVGRPYLNLLIKTKEEFQEALINHSEKKVANKMTIKGFFRKNNLN